MILPTETLISLDVSWRVGPSKSDRTNKLRRQQLQDNATWGCLNIRRQNLTASRGCRYPKDKNWDLQPMLKPIPKDAAPPGLWETVVAPGSQIQQVIVDPSTRISEHKWG